MNEPISNEAREAAQKEVGRAGPSSRGSYVQLAINTATAELRAENERLKEEWDYLVFELTGDEGEDDSRDVLKQYVTQLRAELAEAKAALQAMLDAAPHEGEGSQRVIACLNAREILATKPNP